MTTAAITTEPGALFLGIRSVSRRYDISRATVWRWCREGRFPQPRYLMGHRVWRLADLEAWELEALTDSPPPTPVPPLKPKGGPLER